MVLIFFGLIIVVPKVKEDLKQKVFVPFAFNNKSFSFEDCDLASFEPKDKEVVFCKE